MELVLVSVLPPVVPAGATPRTYTVPMVPAVMEPNENVCDGGDPAGVEHVAHVVPFVEYSQLVKLLGSRAIKLDVVADTLPVFEYVSVYVNVGVVPSIIEAELT